ncbi:MAG: DUF1127 domain-containing protein [Geminicoccaceae bacterium]
MPVSLEIGPMYLVKRILLAWRQYRHFHAAMAELGNRSDRELADWGVARGDIVGLAYAEAERRAGLPVVAGRSAQPARDAALAAAR